ncbi:hypothetical protein C8J56DRAFT_1047541 [Mycena floridula]|nr:hypothetical protein C8J56DRAFT_1047541 [Mycena floridula]
MNSRIWSWIFILVNASLAVHAADQYSGREILPRAPKGSKANVPAIVGGIIVTFSVLLTLLLCFLLHGRRKTSQLEDGVEPSVESSRRWASKFRRFTIKNDRYVEKDRIAHDEKIPRYMRASVAFERESPSPSPTIAVEPLVPPKTPAMPRTAHLPPDRVTLAIPTSAPLTRSGRFDHGSRSNGQMSAHPSGARQMASSPLAGTASRKRDLLPNFFRKASSPRQERQRIRLSPGVDNSTPDELARRMQEKKRAIGLLEAKSRIHQHHAHSPTTSLSSTTCEIDEKIQQDLAELQYEVQTLHKLLPQDIPRVYNKAF